MIPERSLSDHSKILTGCFDILRFKTHASGPIVVRHTYINT